MNAGGTAVRQTSNPRPLIYRTGISGIALIVGVVMFKMLNIKALIYELD